MGLFGGSPNEFRSVYYKGGDARFLAMSGMLSPLGPAGKLTIESDMLIFRSGKILMEMPFSKVRFSRVTQRIDSRGSQQQAIAFAAAGTALGSLGAMAKDLFVKIPFVDGNGMEQEPEFEFANKGEARRFQQWLYARTSKRRARVDEGVEQDPLTILRARYARGEITRKEYERMKEDLLS